MCLSRTEHFDEMNNFIDGIVVTSKQKMLIKILYTMILVVFRRVCAFRKVCFYNTPPAFVDYEMSKV